MALFGALRLFDRVLERSNTDALRRQFFGHLTQPRVSFFIGLLVTGVTTSVAFSLGVVAPLYNRGYVEREEIIPYVLGSNVGTRFDTLVVAIVLDTNDGVAVVLALLVLSVVVTLVALIDPDGYSRAVSTLDDRLLADRRAFLDFLAMLLVVPLALLLVPPVVG